jgi:hypothetical protein
MAIPHSLLEKRKLMYNGVFRYLQLDCRVELDLKGKTFKGKYRKVQSVF